MTIAYWIVAGVLALQYLYSGGLKVARDPEQLKPMMAWVDSVPLAAIKTLGVLEVLGAVGVIIPPLTGITPWLATAAAISLALIQVGAIIFHIRIGQLRVLGLNLGLFALAVATAWLSFVWL